MKGVKFVLTGQTAFFKKPDVNTFLYFSYSQIHKVALLGMLGSIIGLKGYERQKETYPEYYQCLQDLQVAIIPLAKEGSLPGLCSKKVQVFNNSVGYASKEAGGNLIVKEQWLEQPKWEIYLLDNGHPYYTRIKTYLLEQRCEYIPYLGKNDHFAVIQEVEEIELESVEGPCLVNSLCPKEKMAVHEVEIDFWGEEEDEETYFKYEEKLPIALEKEHNQYVMKSFIYTNRYMSCLEEQKFYQAKDKIVYFI